MELFAAPIRHVLPAGESHDRTIVFAPEDRDDIAEVVSVQASARREDDRVGLPWLQFVCELGAGRVRPADRIRRQKLQKVRAHREDRAVAPLPRQRDKSLGRNQALGADARVREEGRQLTGRWSAVAVCPATDHAQAGPKQRVSFRSRALREAPASVPAASSSKRSPCPDS